MNGADALHVGTRTLSGSPFGGLEKAPEMAGLVYTIRQTRCKTDVLLTLEMEELLRPPLSSNIISPWLCANHSPTPSQLFTW